MFAPLCGESAAANDRNARAVTGLPDDDRVGRRWLRDRVVARFGVDDKPSAISPRPRTTHRRDR